MFSPFFFIIVFLSTELQALQILQNKKCKNSQLDKNSEICQEVQAICDTLGIPKSTTSDIPLMLNQVESKVLYLFYFLFPPNSIKCEHVNSGRWWGTGRLACCSPWGRKELDMTWWLNSNSKLLNFIYFWLCWVFIVAQAFLWFWRAWVFP